MQHSSAVSLGNAISIGPCSILLYYPNANSRIAPFEGLPLSAADLLTAPLLNALSLKAIWVVLAHSKEPNGMDALSTIVRVCKDSRDLSLQGRYLEGVPHLLRSARFALFLLRIRTAASACWQGQGLAARGE
jgi:hypothetical protein